MVSPLTYYSENRKCHLKKKLANIVPAFKLIQDEGTKRSPTSFSLVTSTNVGISPQNFLTFSFNIFDIIA